ncbi:MAG: HipA domain-containing protein [Clostridium perfringens]|nr:HipA domain-containing protein [Clostridium perfringens]
MTKTNLINSSSYGILEKVVEEINGEKYLFKGVTEILNGERLYPGISEVIVSDICELFNIDCVRYDLVTRNNDLYTKCKWFYDSNVESYISASNYLKSIRLGDKRLAFDEICSLNTSISNSINEMIFIDYLINNTDRHFKNFGFVIDEGNNMRLAPLFDNGFSLLADLDDNYLKSEVLEDILLDCDYSKSFLSSNRDVFLTLHRHSDKIKDRLLAVKVEDLLKIVDKHSDTLSEIRIKYIKLLLEERYESIKRVYRI